MADMVVMEHPKIEGQTTTVPRRSFERVWKGKGWKLVDENKSAGEVKLAAKNAGIQSADYDDMTNEELRDELGGRDLATSGNKPELTSRLTDDDDDKETNK